MEIIKNCDQLKMFLTILLLIVILTSGSAKGHSSTTTESNSINVISALIRYSYISQRTGKFEHDQGELGRYASSSPADPVSGLIVHVLGEDGANHGCTTPVNVPANVPWVALVQRGTCKFQHKLLNTAFFSNATAVVIYNNVDEPDLITMSHSVDHVVSVFMGKHDGEMLANLADSGVEVQLDISIGQITVYDIVSSTGLKPPTLLIISVSLVGLLILGLIILFIFGMSKSRYNKKKQSTRNVVFSLHKPGQVHESLLSELDVHEHSGEQPANGVTFSA